MATRGSAPNSRVGRMNEDSNECTGFDRRQDYETDSATGSEAHVACQAKVEKPEDQQDQEPEDESNGRRHAVQSL